MSGSIKMYGRPLGVKQKLEIVGGGLQECIQPTGWSKLLAMMRIRALLS
jgi:hypothetical protein